MVDETNAHDAASSNIPTPSEFSDTTVQQPTPKQPASAASVQQPAREVAPDVPEPVILEEVIIKKSAPAQPIPPAPKPTPLPTPAQPLAPAGNAATPAPAPAPAPAPIDLDTSTEPSALPQASLIPPELSGDTSVDISPAELPTAPELPREILSTLQQPPTPQEPAETPTDTLSAASVMPTSATAQRPPASPPQAANPSPGAAQDEQLPPELDVGIVHTPGMRPPPMRPLAPAAPQSAQPAAPVQAPDALASSFAASNEGTMPEDDTPAAAITLPTERTGVLDKDIAQILQDVKLPERRGPAAAKQIENKAAVFDTLSGTPPADTVQKTDAPAARGTETHDAPSSVVPLRTLKDDLQHVVQDQHMSVVRAVSLEQEKRAHEPPPPPPTFATAATSHTVRNTLLSALALFVLGAGALYTVYAVMQSRTAQIPQLQTSSLLFAENSVPFSIDGQSPDAIKQALAGARTSLQGTLGSITQLVPTTGGSPGGNTTARPVTFSEFMKAIGAHPPDELLRALSDNFFFGVHAADKNAPVLVIPVLSYDHAFAGMLAWEPNMNADLAPVFTAVPQTTVDQHGLPTYRTFQDLTMRNYDVRALKDDSGTIQLYYSFPSQNILVIAESPYSFPEVLSRLQAAREL